jgi:hypothetical protein
VSRIQLAALALTLVNEFKEILCIPRQKELFLFKKTKLGSKKEVVEKFARAI